MFKSINQWAFPEEMSPAEMLREAKRLGFEAFEPAVAAAGGFLSLESPDEDFRALRREADALGMRLSSLASGLAWRCSPTSNDPATREQALRQSKRLLECAALLGVEAVLLVPGTVGTGFWGGEDDFVDLSDAWARAVAHLRALAPEAERLGVVIGIENVWNNLIISPMDMRAMLDAVGSPCVQAYFDIGNAVKFGFPEMWVRVLAGRIIRVHVKDFKRESGTLAGFCDPLRGDVNFPAVLDALRAAGYDADLTAEVSGADEWAPGMRLEYISGALDRILGRK